jgi:hypothetical protein
MDKLENTQRDANRSEQEEKQRYDAPRLKKEQNLKKIARDTTFSIGVPLGP